MSYVSIEFLLFILGIALIYYIVPKRFQWVILLIASYGFYLSSGVAQLAFIVTTTIVTYFSGRLMQSRRDDYKDKLKKLGDKVTKDQKKEMKKEVGKKIKRIQVATVLFHLLVLAVIKYSNFAIGNINTILNIVKEGAALKPLDILVPLGISFYTFQSIGYIIDIGRGKYKAEQNLGRLALFISFFPSIVQGPINRYDDLGAQLKAEHKFDYTKFKFGAQLMLWGFFKKMVIADRAAPFVGEVFSSNYQDYSGSVYFVGMLMYAVQIYCDFSGGIDIARGAAQMLGIDMPLNFERPYFSESMADYWRRWHISLGAWMREYVFYPVMLSKPVTKISKFFRSKGQAKIAKLVPTVITPFVVFFLIGIWHGASWQYIAFGLYNATVVAGGVALQDVFKKGIEVFKINTENFSWKLFRIVRTFFISGGSKILVSAPSLTAALYMFKSIFTDFNLDFVFGLDGQLFELGIDKKNMFVLFVCVLVLLLVSVLKENGMQIRETIAKQNIVFRWSIYIIALIVVLVFGIYGPAYDSASFIYEQY